MELKIIILLSIVIIVSECEQKCDKMRELVREKRAKYYSNPPQRFYRRPPMTYPVKGPFSYTPPPFVTSDNADPFPPSNRPPKVSKKVRNDGLGEEDINNLVKYLSKQDLDKIIDIAYEKDKHNNVPFETGPPIKDERQRYYKLNTEQYKDVPFEYANNPGDNYEVYKSVDNMGQNFASPDLGSNDQKPYEIEYNSPPQENVVPRIVNTNPNFNIVDSVSTPFDVQESMQHSHITSVPTFYNKHIQDIYDTSKANDQNQIYTDSKVMNEEILPRPVNLRDDEYIVSFTHNVPNVVKVDESYKVESFGDLPLMNYNSKLDSVSSYHVPHYTVTTSNKRPSPSYSAPQSSYSAPPSSTYSSSSSDVPLEPAPPASEAKAQSDAHLKAIRIWTHRSKGTAYYLHSDGTLSLEKPQKPKPYGS
ncbi:uncharacterized protein LOC132902017 [Amyelois transitella]|uniref:uncharacterized protein LOC132902017 n=1 Tax=Amyelois transitella TaxID=680683 RepID=UPI00298F3EE0|nr:uncharacterized protein LOC132902017 [Amyelois transitella]